MNILQICNKVPFPPKDGGCIAMNNLTQGLINEGHSVKVLSVNTQKHFIDIEKLPPGYRSKTNIEVVFIDTRVKIAAAFFNLFTNKSYNIQRFHSIPFEKKLIEILKSQTFDIIQIEGLYVSMYLNIIRKHSKAKIVLRAHNIEYQIWEHATKLAKNPLKKAYLSLLTKRLKKYELSSLQAFDAIACITKKIEEHYKNAGFLKPMETFSFGIDFDNKFENTSVLEEYPSLFHIGAMDWQPNIEGINWFLNTVWDKLHEKHPDLKIYLAGRNMSAEIKQLNKTNVIIVGEVENAHQFMQSKSIMIVPLHSGSGMRIKIIEGFMLGKTIVTTSLGVEGIDCENNINCLIANNASEFAKAISKCISDKLFCNEIGKNAKILAQQQYNNSDICKRLTEFYEKLIR